MVFISTKAAGCESGGVSFREAVLRCLPQEGGLFVPASPPDLRPLFIHMDGDTAFGELVNALTPPLFGDELNPAQAGRIAGSAAAFSPELVRLNPEISVLKLYNGPTGTFKDFGIGFLAALLEQLLAPSGGAMVVSAARSSGSSIARTFIGRRGITAVLLYPRNVPITGLDENDYVTNGGNVIPIQVEGSADDCQELVNALINDRPFAERYHITSANSINPGRVLSQAFIFIYAFILLKKTLPGDLFFSLPTGNLGSLISGLYAWKFGMPVNGYIAAMNSNNAAGSFIGGGALTGEAFTARPLVATRSPGLDIARPSNLERLNAFYGEAPAVMKNMVFHESVDDGQTLAAMKRAWEKYGLLLDPQSAVAFAAAEKTAAGKDFDGHVAVFATGHPARYAETVYEATGQKVSLPEGLESLKKPAKPVARIDKGLENMENAIAGCL
jgi:threonine synthase